MMNKIKIFLLAVGCLLWAAAVDAAASERDPRNDSAWSHFTWGAEAGGAIDMTSNDLSSVNLDAYFGYRNRWLNVLGVGAEVNMMVSSSVRAFPIYAMLRTGFSSRPTLLFMDLRGGVVLNNVGAGKQQTSPYVSTGVGVNLATGATFKSYIVLSYVYNGMEPFKKGDQMCDVDGLSMACLRIGINF